MPFTQDFRTQRRNYDDGLTRIGELDRLWYEPTTNTIRISDGVTPGGIVVGGGSGSGPATTDQLPEGINNLYFTEQRVESVLSTATIDAATLDGLDSTAFATAAQGTLAETSIQPGDAVSSLVNDTGYITLTDLSASGDLTYDNVTGEFSVVTYDSLDFDVDFTTKTTDDLSEGVSNLYYTNARVSAYITGGTGVSVNNGVVSIGQSVGINDAVAFNSVTGDVIGSVFGDDSTIIVDAVNNQLFGNLTGNVTGQVSDISNFTTTDLAEGVNLYFTDNRVTTVVNDTSISALLDVDSDLVINLSEDSILIYNANSNEFVAESFLAVLDRLKAELEVQYDKLVDEEGTFTYIGEAEPGSLRTAPVWRIKRVAEAADGDLEILYANGSAAFDKIWENRTTFTYA